VQQASIKNRLTYGVHFSFEGGEEDNTVRPTILSPETLKALKDECPPIEYSNGIAAEDHTNTTPDP
jgi:hypothetical protein